jgi:hypothetical protein
MTKDAKETPGGTKRKRRSNDKSALEQSGNRDAATPVNSANKTPTSQKGTGKKKKKKLAGKTTPPAGDTQATTPPSVGSGVKFIPVAKMEKFSEAAQKKLASKTCEGNELKEREARKMVEENSNLMQVEVRNGMWPWLSEVSLDSDGNIYFYRNQVNHNAISPNLSNEITNNFLNNPLCADLKGKVHSRSMGTDMICFLTYNDEVSVN